MFQSFSGHSQIAKSCLVTLITSIATCLHLNSEVIKTHYFHPNYSFLPPQLAVRGRVWSVSPLPLAAVSEPGGGGGGADDI